MIQRTIPSSGELLPVMGIGTWQTFNVPVRNNQSDGTLSAVLDIFYQSGGRLIDSSPMYGHAEAMVGKLTEALPEKREFFYATKVWTKGKADGIRQMEDSFQKMQVQTMDLIQIHNLVDWEIHLKTLRAWKEEGRIRYIGITHYTDDAHPLLEKVINSHPIDFVQFNYSLFNRHAETHLLHTAANRGVATIINRPFGEGRIFAKVAGKPLPEWAQEYGIASWSQFFLKYIISHSAVTCVIPATSDPEHAADNMKSGDGMLPDDKVRKKMLEWVAGF